MSRPQHLQSPTKNRSATTAAETSFFSCRQEQAQNGSLFHAASSFIDCSTSSHDPPGEYTNSLPYVYRSNQSPSLEESCVTYYDNSNVSSRMVETSAPTIDNYNASLPASPPPLPTSSEQVKDMGDAIVRQDVSALVTMLVCHGYDPNSRMDASGTSALAIAARLDRVHLAALLVEYGADVNLPNAHGETPLMMAAMYQCRAMVDYLLREARADVTVMRATTGDTALDYATKKRQSRSQPASTSIIDTLLRAEHRHAKREQRRQQQQLYEQFEHNTNGWTEI
jgi:ankyrin repeat protein